MEQLKTEAADRHDLMDLRDLLHRLEHAMIEIEKITAAESRLCASDFRILELLSREGPTPVNNIGDQVMLTSGSMSTAVVRLKKRGLVNKQADRTDRRIQLVSLTHEGFRLIERIKLVYQGLLERAFVRLEPGADQKLSYLLSLLERDARRVIDRP